MMVYLIISFVWFAIYYTRVDLSNALAITREDRGLRINVYLFTYFMKFASYCKRMNLHNARSIA